MGKLLDQYIKRYYEEDGDEIDEADVENTDADSYAVQYCDMHTAIHHLILCDTVEQASNVFDSLIRMKEIEDNLDEYVEDKEEQLLEIDEIKKQIDEFAKDDIEINYRNVEETDGERTYNHKGEKILIISDYVVDMY